ncbi:TetR family transcriptional regulator [Pseudomonas mandelii]|uniref:TetR family transcriptional regulator n=1 Tax=Pseudomonas mandelii TaxID=75612 RepID=UPI00398CEC83
MNSKRLPSEVRKKELQLALHRIVLGKSKSAAKKLSIAAVAREAGVSAALIHNHYPEIAEAIRNAQGRSSRNQRDVKQKDLLNEQEKTRKLRQQISELQIKVASLASLNETLLNENSILKAKREDPKIVNLI